MSHDSSYIIIGKVTGAHGIHGALKVTPFTQSPEHFLDYSAVYLKQNEEIIQYKIKKGTIKGKQIHLALQNVNNRNDAEALKNTNIYIHQDQVQQPDEEEFFYKDLIHMRVFDEENQEIGHVIQVHNFGAGDILEIEQQDKTSFMILFTKENVPTLSLKEKRLTIRQPQQLETPKKSNKQKDHISHPATE